MYISERIGILPFEFLRYVLQYLFGLCMCVTLNILNVQECCTICLKMSLMLRKKIGIKMVYSNNGKAIQYLQLSPNFDKIYLN